MCARVVFFFLGTMRLCKALRAAVRSNTNLGWAWVSREDAAHSACSGNQARDEIRLNLDYLTQRRKNLAQISLCLLDAGRTWTIYIFAAQRDLAGRSNSQLLQRRRLWASMAAAEVPARAQDRRHLSQLPNQRWDAHECTFP